VITITSNSKKLKFDDPKFKTLIKWRNDRSKRILYLMLGVTYRCQFACNHCAVNSYIKKGQKELTTDEIKSLIDQSSNLFALNLIEGEPTLRKDILEIIEYASDKAILITIDSNGIVITKEYAQYLKKNIQANKKFKFYLIAGIGSEKSIKNISEESTIFLILLLNSVGITWRGNLVKPNINIATLNTKNPLEIDKSTQNTDLKK